MAEPLPKLGILAGGGNLPLHIIRQCQRQNRPFFVLGFKDQVNPADYAAVPFGEVRLGAVQQALSLMRQNDVKQLVMAGHVQRPSLASLRPDATALKFLMGSKALSFGDDGLLSRLVDWLEKEQGFEVVGADSLLSEAGEEDSGHSGFPIGPLGTHQADAAARADIQRGREVLLAVGPVDVGQAVVVQDKLVLGIEAVEGTEALLARCAGLKREGSGGVLVKLRKPGQERRADMPVIGPETVQQAAVAGLSGVAIDAGGMIVLDREQTVAAADASGLFIEAVEPLAS